MWLDKLGQSALSGVQVVVRQSLIGSAYALIDQDGNPTPVSTFDQRHSRGG
jgi:hypothetical protein